MLWPADMMPFWWPPTVPDAISGALKEAAAAGVKIVYVDSPANVDAAATFSTDNAAAGQEGR